MPTREDSSLPVALRPGKLKLKCQGLCKQHDRQCRRWPTIGREFCKLHGGHAARGIAHGNYKHGKFTKHLPVSLAAKYNAAREDKELLSLKDDIAIAEAREVELFEMIDTGESGKVWKKLQKAGDAFQRAYETGNSDKLMEVVQNIRSLVQEGQPSYSLWEELLYVQEHKRKLTETENKMLISKQQMITVEQLMIYAGVILDSIRTHVIKNTEKQVGAKILNNISYDFDRISLLEAVGG